MKYDRLLKLAGHLENLPNESQFDYRHWVGPTWKTQDLSCGTTACALGWAVTIPEFYELGLRFVRDSITGVNYVGMAGSNKRDHKEASREVFGLTATQHSLLFNPFARYDGDHTGCGPENGCCGTGSQPCSFATAKQVAAHIRRVVAETQAADPEWQKAEADRKANAKALNAFLDDSAAAAPAEPQRERLKVGG